MSVIIALLVLAAAAPQASVDRAAAAPVAETEAVRAARDWLELHDAGRWRETWEGTSAEFRRQNSLEVWSETAQAVRPPLGAMISRVAIGQRHVPAPPAGVEVVSFRTRFAGRGEAVETVSLARQDGAWKIAGIHIE